MKVILFGATGMVGQGVLRECLRDECVDQILAVGRTALGQAHPKLRELSVPDLSTYDGQENDLIGYDACFFCLGVSAAGMSEADYTRVTFGYTLAAAEILVKLNPGMTFIYVSGAGTDSTEQGRAMWARVKGRTENALLCLPFKAVYLFRPGLIRPLHDVKSKTRAYRIFYVLAWPLLPLLACFPSLMTTTERIGRAMLRAAREGAPKPVLESREINELGT
ncbi:MAG: epimerase [Holophagaceae bacterium]|nr:epimerase [Holophagaceae bacterium]